MKKLLFAALLIVAFSSATVARDIVVEGKSHTSLGDYKIEIADNSVKINGEEFTPFVISYQNSTMEVKVAVKNESDCKKYYVLSDKLSVQYVCHDNYFGVERLDKYFEKEGYSTADEYLDRSEYFHQKALTSGQGHEMDNAMLIAAYFPRLLKSENDLVAAK